MSTIRYGDARRTWAGSYRDEIPSRERGPAPDQFIGLVRFVLPGFELNWTLPQDMRDLRRFRAVDLDGVCHGHATPRELARTTLALILPHYSGH